MESRDFSTCFILPWYGNYPLWMKYFLRSAAYNPGFNWLLVSDEKPKEKLPENFKYLELSITQFEGLVFKSVGITPQITHPYKFCDFKPAFGDIFSEYLTGFDYWGYCDLDVVFGNLPKLLAPFYNRQFDIFAPDTDFFPGHFCLFRNSDYINSLYRKAFNYKKVFSAEYVFFFDEFLYPDGIEPNNDALKRVISSKIRKHKKLSKIKNISCMKLFRPIYKSLRKQHNNKSLQDFNSAIESLKNGSEYRIIQEKLYRSDVEFFVEDKKDWTIKWQVGELFDKNELLYFHFQLSKNNPRFTFEKTKDGFTMKLC